MDLSSLLNNHKLEKEKKIAVAVSGGIDSLSLVLVADQWAKRYKMKIVGITVDHALRKKSESEAQYVHNLLESRGIEHHTLKWTGPKPTNNIEAIAREKRYELLTNFCKKHKIEILLVAHHLQDQAETFFIRLFRGSGIDGLAAIKNYNKYNGIKIVRPFLEIDKETLRKYLVKNKIKWIEDESNESDKFLRNRIRKFLDSLEDKKNILKRIDFAVSEIGKAKNLIEKELQNIEKKVTKFDTRGFYTVNTVEFKKIGQDLGLRLLAKILMRVSGNKYKPRLIKLKNIYSKILNGLSKETFYGCILKKTDNKKFVVYREYSAIGKDVKILKNQEVTWDKRFIIHSKRDVENLSVTHFKKGSLNQFLRKLKSKDYKKYKEIKSLRGIDKDVFYTIPILKKDGKIFLSPKKFGVKVETI